MLKQNPFIVLTEAMKTESFEVDDLEDVLGDDQSLQDDIGDAFEDIDELDDDIEYTAEMVNVIQQESVSELRYLVEMDNLAKYMESANVTDVSEALTSIAECNSLDVDLMCVVIESEDYAVELLEEAKKMKKSDPTKTKQKGIKSTLDVINMLKTKGIKVVKKKSKAKRKKKK